MEALGLRGGRLVLPDAVVPGDLLVQDGRIAAVGEGVARRAPRALDVSSFYVAPGFLDLQANGALGQTFLTAPAEGIQAILDFFARHGTTGLLATLTSAPWAELRAALARLRGIAHPVLLGVHLEGPFLAEGRRGAHPQAHLRPPSAAAARDLLGEFGPLIRLWTLAPELPGALEVLRILREEGVVGAAGHSEASYDEACQAFATGVALVTHLFNGMRPLHHREPGLVGAALEREVFVSLICDGIHVHPAVLRLVAKWKGFDRLILVTDAVAPTGLPDGDYELFGHRVRVEGGAPRLPDGTLAGSTLTLDRAIRNFREFTGCSLSEAVRCATLNPARLLGIDDRKGSLAPGKDADLVVFDEDLTVHYTIVGGRIVYQRG
ncbi:MAG: N-acetylglucosamine-6-phosphate deacetylase [Candidatus Bipolaricaulota bacterium]|nr:N-acetylglucosamine-6-phosphate deacetylase [Candidatus Bipolaricaulota bacterium]MCX7843942.1 N-acetylglucosamine-6-phosphate deacetylase [Candidatus Bipolaricaulota bacterium]MDW8151689.1 N-acetylglucosamine-6-phosphate deacetylase [Candidatus Bipolaricaulota bacterium]